MTTVLFVHGTGVRAEGFQGAFAQVSTSLTARRPDLDVRPCFWGGDLGSKLFADGASIPTPDTTRDLRPVDVGGEDFLLWAQLQDDSLFELRLLTLDTSTNTGAGFHPTRIPIGREIEDRYLSATASSEVAELFREAGLGEEMVDAFRAIAVSPTFQRLAESPNVDRELAWAVVIRATVAEAMDRAEFAGAVASAVYDPTARDALVRDIHRVLTEEYRSRLGQWTKRKAGDFVANRVTAHVASRRRLISEASYPFVGDVLFYQSNGAAIRAFVQDHIETSQPPVIVLAHSLGGIICMDLLSSMPLPVDCLVTVGTAAPLVYELDSLRCLRAGQPLPDHFPRWINIYDPRDLLAYVGAGLFDMRVEDVQVDNGQAFPRCHGAYWWNKQTWDAVIGALA